MRLIAHDSEPIFANPMMLTGAIFQMMLTEHLPQLHVQHGQNITQALASLKCANERIRCLDADGVWDPDTDLRLCDTSRA